PKPQSSAGGRLLAHGELSARGWRRFRNGLPTLGTGPSFGRSAAASFCWKFKGPATKLPGRVIGATGNSRRGHLTSPDQNLIRRRMGTPCDVCSLPASKL